ncbi:alpha/beta hydrolase [Devosia sediminis]|uniref:Alpha/beta hydrolase n=1 Tax=Devosia sediminis TaxID=2798801 RepID=A0A934MQQ7_9HYPH|nr:hypothetical protein [Devosia sediminis]MBJ3784609.1 hypothetical protein [Devosia sediminis]
MRFLTGAVAMTLAFITATTAMAETLLRGDGSPIHYHFDRPDGPVEGLILIAQGSGCAAAADNASLAAVRDAFAGYAAVTVEKSGVTPEAGIVDGFADCPAAFHETYTLTQRVEDYRTVLAHVRQDEELAGPKLVLFGGSEGGLAVAQLAATEEPYATIILSSATGMTLEEIILMTLPPEGQVAVSAGFDAARADPEGSAIFAGSSHRFWADILDQRALDAMLISTAPFLLIQGGLDTSSPPAASRPTLDAYAKAGACGLTYWEFPGLDHGMLTPAGKSRLDDVLSLAAQWVEQPMTSC